MSTLTLAVATCVLVFLTSYPTLADQRDTYDRRGWQNICRTRVRAMICPTGECPHGMADWRQAQLERCMRHYANVRIRKPGEK
jgi:hypothetical protein